MNKIKKIEINTNDYPVFESQTVTKNEDGTYKIVNIYKNYMGHKELTQIYPRVILKLNSDFVLNNNCACINPFPKFDYIEVLTDNDKDKILFTIELAE